LFISSGKVKDGGCGEPFNLENIEEFFLQISDKVLDKQCQLRLEDAKGQVHFDDLYGDVNVVSLRATPQYWSTYFAHRLFLLLSWTSAM
jgi:hypothetical protein